MIKRIFTSDPERLHLILTLIGLVLALASLVLDVITLLLRD